MDAGLAALLGAGAGAFGSLATTAVTTIGNRKAASDAGIRERHKAMTERQLTAYTDLVTRVQEVRMSWWRVSQALEHGGKNVDRDALKRDVESPWTAYLAAVALMMVVVPEQVSSAVSKLAGALEDMDLAGQNWLLGVGGKAEYAAKGHEADQRRQDLTKAFASLIATEA